MTKLEQLLFGKNSIECAGSGTLHVTCLPCRSIKFDSKEDLHLLRTMAKLAASTFGKSFQEPRGKRLRHVFQGADTLLLLHDGSRLLGFMTAMLALKNFLYLHGIVIDSKIHGKGGAKLLMDAVLGLSRHDAVFIETQNPIAFCLLSSVCSKIYPSPTHDRIPTHLLRQIYALKRTGLPNPDPKTGVLRNFYSRCLYEHIPESNDATLNEWLAHRLSVKDGRTRHALLVIGTGLRR